MPSPFGIIDSSLATFMMGTCKILRPTGVTNTPLQTLGYLENAKLSIKISEAALKTKLPEYELLSWNIGMSAELSAEIGEPPEPSNLEMFTGDVASDSNAWTPPVALFSGYTKGAQTVVVTGDVAADIGTPPVLLRITEVGVGTEDFIAAKVVVSTNTTITLPLGDTLVNSYTVAATVSRASYKTSHFGRVEAVTTGQGVLLFSGFQPQVGAAYKALMFTVWKLGLPRNMDYSFDPAKFLTAPFVAKIYADPTKPNGEQLGKIDVYSLTGV